MSAHAVSLSARYRHRARHAAPAARWPYRRVLALMATVFVAAFVVGTVARAYDARPAGHVRPVVETTWTNTTTQEPVKGG